MNNNDDNENKNLLVYQTEKLINLMQEMHKCCEIRMMHEHLRFNLPPAELSCLMTFDGERYLSFKGVAQKLDVAKSRVTKIVNGLTGKGLVKCITDPADARIRLISLTPAGIKKTKEVNAFKRDLHKQLLLQMTPEDRAHALTSLELVRASMEAVKDQLK